MASLWEVPDNATKEIMVRFYQHLKDGQSKSLALRNAKLRYIENHKNSKLNEPYYWAGFVLYGEDVAVIQKTNSIIWYVLGIIIFLIIAVSWFSKRNN